MRLNGEAFGVDISLDRPLKPPESRRTGQRLECRIALLFGKSKTGPSIAPLGRLVAGPTLIEITTAPPADLLWCLESTDDPKKFLLGTGALGLERDPQAAASPAGPTPRGHAGRRQCASQSAAPARVEHGSWREDVTEA